MKINNVKIIKELLDSFENNKEYFEDIKNARDYNGKISYAINSLANRVQKVISQINVPKIVELFPKKEIDSGIDSNYNIVLTNSGIYERYDIGNYKSNRISIYPIEYLHNLSKALKVIISHPEISNFQKKKIKELNLIDWEFNIDKDKQMIIKDVEYIEKDLKIITKDIHLPNFAIGSYDRLSDFALLSVKDQIYDKVKEYNEERKSVLSFIHAKIKEVENAYPVLFLFGGDGN